MNTRHFRALFVLLALFSTARCFCEVSPAEPAPEPTPLPYVNGSWTLVALPDTQNYCSSFPDVFTSQTRWIVDNKEKRKIAFVLQEGDVTNNDAPQEWGNAR
jgi:hypothetical protein